MCVKTKNWVSRVRKSRESPSSVKTITICFFAAGYLRLLKTQKFYPGQNMIQSEAMRKRLRRIPFLVSRLHVQVTPNNGLYRRCRKGVDLSWRDV